MAHLVNLDDDASTELFIPKTALHDILKHEQYHYIDRVDTSENKLYMSTYWSSYRTVPDSIINGPIPFDLNLKSSRGDFIWFQVEEITKETLHITLGSDWN